MNRPSTVRPHRWAWGCLLLLGLVLLGCGPQLDLSSEQWSHIRDTGDADTKVRAVSTVDRTLRAHGDLGVYADLSAGIDALTRDGVGFRIEPKEDGRFYVLVSGQGGGHTINLWIDPESDTIDDWNAEQ